MIELSAKNADHAAAPRLAPADPAEPVIDLGHLVRMTLGERSLQREVLALFNRQAELLLARMQGALPATIADHAHTLKGSAAGIGAWPVAQAALAVEFAAGESEANLARAVARLTAAVADTKAAIATLLAAT
jgi:HPt (histidine-containing phosphotransfer) domain-containing protein